ncbi:MAG: hypothetical protein OXI66_20155 [Boseongicola sp.]|nr:hypothetical protein [Boseongicola sp.]
MARKSVGVLVIHGMGSQGRRKPKDSARPTFSKEMHRRVKRELGKKMDRVVWREVFFAHVLQDRQEAYLKSIKRRTDFDKLRRFVMCNLSDAASYRKTGRRNGGTYSAIHREIDEVVKDLAKDLGPDAPIVIIAHSLGGHIMSNYIYDQQKRRQRTSVTSKPLREMGEHPQYRAPEMRCSLEFAHRKRALHLAAPAPQPNSEKERKLSRHARLSCVSAARTERRELNGSGDGRMVSVMSKHGNTQAQPPDIPGFPENWREEIKADLAAQVEAGGTLYGVRSDGAYIARTKEGDRVLSAPARKPA